MPCLEPERRRGSFFLGTGLLSFAILSMSTGFGGLASAGVDSLAALIARGAGFLLTINPVYGLGSLFLYSILGSTLAFGSEDF